MILGDRSNTFELLQAHSMKMESSPTKLVHYEELGLYYVAVVNEWSQKYIKSAKRNVHD